MAAASLSLCVNVLHYLRSFDAPLADIAYDLRVSQTQARRAIKALQSVATIEFCDDGFWRLSDELDRAQAIAVATSIFLDDLDGRALLERVGLKER